MIQVDDDVFLLLLVADDDEEASLLLLLKFSFGACKSKSPHAHLGTISNQCGYPSIAMARLARGASPSPKMNSYMAFFTIAGAPQASPPAARTG